MKPSPLISLLCLGMLNAIAFPSFAQEDPSTPQAANASSQNNFYCDLSQDIPSTMVTDLVNTAIPDPSSLINWSTEYFDSVEEAQSICETVSQKLQTLYESKELTTLTFVANRIDDRVGVCLEVESNIECDKSQVLFTLNTDQAPEKALYSVISDTFKPTRTRGDFPTRMRVFDFSWLP